MRRDNHIEIEVALDQRTGLRPRWAGAYRRRQHKRKPSFPGAQLGRGGSHERRAESCRGRRFPRLEAARQLVLKLPTLSGGQTAKQQVAANRPCERRIHDCKVQVWQPGGHSPFRAPGAAAGHPLRFDSAYAHVV